MSHSQFHSTNLFILRHAWLNLWDKHMTTGRINQVTTFRSAFTAVIYSRATHRSLSWLGVHLSYCQRLVVAQGFPSLIGTSLLESTTVITSFPILARLSWDPLCPRTRVTHLLWGLPVTGDAWKAHAITADPRVASCIRFDHRQEIHPPSPSLKCNHLSHQRQAKTHVPRNRQGQSHFELGSLHNRTH